MALPWNIKYPYVSDEILNLDWILTHFKEFIEEIASLDSWRTEHEKEYEELKKYYDDLVSGNLSPELEAALYKWTVENSASIINSLTKMVFFGITDEGYFVAYIPDSWEDITFYTTGLDINLDLMPEYGHLVLAY